MSTEPPITADLVNTAIAEAWPDRPYECVEVSATHALTRLDVDQTALRPGNYISGPTQFSLADTVLWHLTFGAVGRIEPMALTSELSIRFLRPAQGAALWARADLERVGRSSLVGTVRIWVDDRVDRPVSTAQGTYALPRTS